MDRHGAISFIEKLNGLHTLNSEAKTFLEGCIEETEYRAGQKLLEAAQICRKVYYIKNGLIRAYYLNDGNEVTSRFMEDGYIFTSWLSFYTQQPGHEYAEAIEHTIIESITYEDIQNLYSMFPEININGRKIVEHAFYLSEQRTQLLRKHTAEEKYEIFISESPTLLQRVSQKQIASYLGMNEETLSRVRTRFHKSH